jgi:hypothetical protein
VADAGPLLGVMQFNKVALSLFIGYAGALMLLLAALWWSWAGDGIEVPRERWPAPVRLLALVGWGCFIGGLFGQVIAHVRDVGVARW